MRIVTPDLTHSRFQHVFPGLWRMNKQLTMDFQLGCPILIHPDDDGQLTVHNPIVDTLAWSLDIVLDTSKDVL